MTEFHADDYGMFPEQSERILDCARNGCLNGVSIMPNSPYLDECMKALEPYRDTIGVTVHLNFMEGKALTPADKIPDLVNEDGIFDISFFKMYLGSCNPLIRKRLKQQLKLELKAQIDRTLPYLDKDAVRLDGHGHYHMIPVYFDALSEVIKENGYHVTFIRLPYEVKALYSAHSSEIDRIIPVNRVKVMVLNHMVKRNKRKHQELIKSLEPFMFMGVMLSGHMSYNNIEPLLNDAVELAQKENSSLEVLFHPGSVLEPDRIKELTDKGDHDFLTSPWREKEADALKRL